MSEDLRLHSVGEGMRHFDTASMINSHLGVINHTSEADDVIST